MSEISEKIDDDYKIEIDKAWEEFQNSKLSESKSLCEKLIMIYPENFLPLSVVSLYG